jgi:hypothetical protein
MFDQKKFYFTPFVPPPFQALVLPAAATVFASFGRFSLLATTVVLERRRFARDWRGSASKRRRRTAAAPLAGGVAAALFGRGLRLQKLNIK